MKFVASKTWMLLSALVIALVSVIVYLPALKIGFYDGWWYLRWAATMNLPRYLVQFFDPANITQGYRPVQGLYIYLLYHLFGFNPDGFHIAHTLLHAANSVLLFLIVLRLAKKWHAAFLAALVYAALPAYSLAVFWHAVVDPLSGFFYLLTILLWIMYQETRRKLDWTLTFVVFLFALLSKEIAIFLPLVLFLIEWWFFGRKPHLSIHVPRYAPFIVALFPYIWLDLQVQSHGEFAGQFGFRLGPHMFTNLLPYLAVLAFPWITNLPTDAVYYIWLAIAALVYLGVMFYKKSLALLFLLIVAVLNISPLTGFPLDYFNARYLYLSMMISAVLLALLFERGRQALGAPSAYAALIAATLIALLVALNGMHIAEAAADLAEYTRQVRVPFRDISRQHPQFPDDTYLYFVHSPFTSVWDFEGLFFVRYGTGVTVNATDAQRPANLRSHNQAFVYYFDPTGRPIELSVDKDDTTHAAPALPARYAIPLTLEKYEVPSSTLQRGKALVAILNWRATAKVDKDYTVFAHLVDASGKAIAEFDSQPMRGEDPTSNWESGRLMIDAMVLPIASDAPLGENYRLEIGMYDPATMNRLSFINANGDWIGDVVVIEPFSIVP